MTVKKTMKEFKGFEDIAGEMPKDGIRIMGGNIYDPKGRPIPTIILATPRGPIGMSLKDFKGFVQCCEDMLGRMDKEVVKKSKEDENIIEIGC